MDDASLIRTSEYMERGMFVTAIYGLNIFVTNGQANIAAHDPRVAFARAFGDALYRAAHVGDMALEGDAPQDYFTSETLSSQGLVTPVGLYNDAFYASPHDNGYVFFGISADFWTTQADDRNGGIDYVIGDDSLALYIHHDISPVNALIQMLEQPILGVSITALQAAVKLDDWLDRVTLLFDYCVVTVSDGWHTLIYSRQPVSVDLIKAASVLAAEKITKNDWYGAHKDELVWEEYLAHCMVTPTVRTRFRELEERHFREAAHAENKQ